MAAFVVTVLALSLVPFPFLLGVGMNIKTLVFVAAGVLGALVVDRFVGVSKLLA